MGAISGSREPSPSSTGLGPAGFDPEREEDDDHYWLYEDDACWNCGGEGYVYGCSWDWQCDTYDEGEGTCLCSRRCTVCHPQKPSAEVAQLQAVLASAIEARSDATPQSGAAEGESAAREAGDAR